MYPPHSSVWLSPWPLLATHSGSRLPANCSGSLRQMGCGAPALKRSRRPRLYRAAAAPDLSNILLRLHTRMTWVTDLDAVGIPNDLGWTCSAPGSLDKSLA